MSEWSVRIELRGAEPLAAGAGSMDTFLEQLGDAEAAVAGGPGSDTYRAQLNIDAATPGHAVALGVERVRKAAELAGLPKWPVVHAQATVLPELARQVATRDLPELVGISEIAALLGVSRQRVHGLTNRDDFPEPIARLASGPVWTRPSIRLFAQAWKRKPRRQSKAEADDLAAGILSRSGRFRRDPNVTDTVGPKDAELVMDLIRNASKGRLRFDAMQSKLGWDRPRLSWVISELVRTFRITYRDSTASVRRCRSCGSDHITFKEVTVGRRHDRDATIQGLPYCRDCGKDAS